MEEKRMSWIISLIIGGVVGWLASIIMKTNAEMGIFANVLVGIVGSILGNWLAGLLGMAPTGNVLRFFVALGGAVLLILILQQIGFFRKRAAERRGA
jgi:uncharacterized membrane protein YeaQ/YmgE (transglycosylase-associated protein family)